MFRSLLLMCVSTSVFLAATPATQTLGRPLVFEPNRGQGPAEVQWLARGSGFQLGFTSDGATLALRRRM